MSLKSDGSRKNVGDILNRLKYLKKHPPYEGYSVKYYEGYGSMATPVLLYKGELVDDEKIHPTANKFHQAHAQHCDERQKNKELLSQALRGRRERLISEALSDFRKSCER